MESKHHYTGLTAREVAQSRSKYGENVLTPPAKAPLWLQFLDKFRDPLIIILLIAGALSILISCYEYFALGDGPTVFFEPVGIFVAIMLATGLSFYFEYQADKEFAILNKVNDDEPVEVIRDSNTTQIPRREVVVGDIVIVNTGEEIPADGELIEATLLNVDESTLTGEPMCAKTTVASEFDSQATFPSNHVMKGTKVMEGHGIMRVLAIGDHTEQGKVFEAVQIDNSVKTPLDEQLDGLGRLVAKLSYCVGAGIIIGRILMYFLSSSYVQFEWLPFIAYLLQTLMIAVTLVVVSVPEGLPMAVTLSLAYSMRRMLKTNNLVRKMHACETMGATTVICTDKTGTLTQNQMRVDDVQLYGVSPNSSAVAESMALNSTAQLDFTDPDCPSVLGNPTEGALLLWLYEHGTDYRELRENSTIVDQLPFNTERKYMATVVDSALMPGKRILYVKGAPEIVFGMCHTMGEGATRERIENQLLDYQNHAMRTLGFAFQMLDKGDVAISNGRVTATRLHFIGITAIADPVRSDVPDAIKECLDAGINIKIVTGDTPATAREIGRQIGLWTTADSDRNIMTGPEFAALNDEQLLQRVPELKIIARARPMDKKRLVETLQRLNQVVAVTGDGTNDAPALRAAHVGLSMGDGTSVAKEASDITIIDNSFSSIGKAVMWGTLVVSEHTEISALPAHRQRYGLSDSAHRSLHGHRVAAHGDADAVDKSDYGHLRSHGSGVVAAVGERNARPSARPPRLHPHTPHVRRDCRSGRTVLRVAVLLPARVQTCRHKQPQRYALAQLSATLRRLRHADVLDRGTPHGIRTDAAVHHIRHDSLLLSVQRASLRDGTFGAPLRRMQGSDHHRCDNIRRTGADG